MELGRGVERRNGDLGREDMRRCVEEAEEVEGVEDDENGTLKDEFNSTIHALAAQLPVLDPDTKEKFCKGKLLRVQIEDDQEPSTLTQRPTTT